LPGWDAIDERAQRDITDRVRPIADADADAAPVSPVNALRNAVTTRMLLASQADEALRAAADAIVARRDDPPVVPAPVVPTPDVPAPDVPAPVVPRPRIVQLGLGDLFGARVTITSSADVEAAVNAIRTRLQREIDAGNAVELGA
jgi:N-acetyl-beta-hexosaminidase